MNTNIQGLSNALEVLNRKIELLNRRIDGINISGGDNVMVTRNGSSFVIDSLNSDVAGESEWCPWKVVITKKTDNDGKETYEASTRGGTINGLVPDNFLNFDTISKEDNKWVYWEADTDNNGISTLSIKTSEEEPETNFKFMEEAVNTTIRGLVAYIWKGQIAVQFMCDNVVARPVVAYQINDPNDFDLLKSYYTWHVAPAREHIV
jgi:hypothetical protein